MPKKSKGKKIKQNMEWAKLWGMGYPGWIEIDCGCCNGIRWGGEYPIECNDCGGKGTIFKHIKSRVLAEYPGGRFLGKCEVVRY